jgi:hypothetical protein
MWSDTLLALERAHLVWLGVWGIANLVLGGGVFLALTWRGAGKAGTGTGAQAECQGKRDAPLLRYFALQMALWGAAEVVFVALRWYWLAERDFTGAMHLAFLLRIAVGVEVAVIVFGVTLAIAGWLITRRLALLGTGMGIIIQGAVLLALDTSLLRHVLGGGAG